LKIIRQALYRYSFLLMLLHIFQGYQL